MPELPEVETVCGGLNQLTTNQMIQGGTVLRKSTLGHPFSVEAFIKGLEGKQLKGWKRRGKYLLAELLTPELNPGGWLGVHLRMTGQLLWVDEHTPLDKHTRVRLYFPQGKELRFVDTRAFGKMWWVSADETLETIITGLAKLGPEPLSREFTVSYLRERLKKTQRAVKAVLLDQNVVAGLGNIYADEVLFKSGLRPDAQAGKIKPEEVEQLHRSIQEVLKKAIEKGGTTFSDFLNLLGVPGAYGEVAWVYNREGKPCLKCKTSIEKMKVAGRSSHFCPSCQSKS